MTEVAIANVVDLTPPIELADYVKVAADRIAASWRKSTAAIIETGQLLNEAEQTFPEEQFQALRDFLISEVGISASVMSKLRMIARNPVLLDPLYQTKLPPSYATLYQISKIDKDALIGAIEGGEITPVTQLKDVNAKFGSLVKKPRKKSLKTMLSVSLIGDAQDIDPEILERLMSILLELEQQVKVSVKGL